VRLARHDKILLGRIVDMRDTSLTVQGTEFRGEWKLPYAAIEPPEPGAKAPAAASAPASAVRHALPARTSAAATRSRSSPDICEVSGVPYTRPQASGQHLTLATVKARERADRRGQSKGEDHAQYSGLPAPCPRIQGPTSEF
jgi:hypothetical protein